MTKNNKPSDLEREAQQLIDAGQMPSLEALLTAIAETRQKYRESDLLTVDETMRRVVEVLPRLSSVELAKMRRSLRVAFHKTGITNVQ